MPRVTVITGPTDVGKSHYVYEHYKEDYSGDHGSVMDRSKRSKRMICQYPELFRRISEHIHFETREKVAIKSGTHINLEIRNNFNSPVVISDETSEMRYTTFNKNVFISPNYGTNDVKRDAAFRDHLLKENRLKF
ncbi:hypothetical protein Glove_214g47 [Diversispora epigaea]|uniref:Uncharacterized protein n=1 Tax=Diversispora epigaea TaxID=1348612 RepID=A0A397IQI7_9GLOM|nr:hypothetical protein Glove_214g47 [Diversispora epigaea]